MAEVLLDAVSQVTEVPTEFKEIEHDGADLKDTEEYPLGTRAMELYDSAVVSRFLSTFGRNKRDIVCECERTNKPSMVQVLHIANGTTINEKLKSKSSCVGKLFEDATNKDLDVESAIENAYLSTLSRPPTEEEITLLLTELADLDREELRLAIEDLYWSLMSSREFLFQH